VENNSHEAAENAAKKMQNGFAIAIDGPVGVGKSTTARLVAQKLNFVYIDTGAMYRAVALFQIENHAGRANIFDEISLESSLEKIQIKIKFFDGAQKIFLNERDVSDLIRTQEVAEGASVVAANAKVRQKLIAQQREIAAANNVVMDGRDIASNVLPRAQVKIFLDADVEIRAARRAKELAEKNFCVDFEKILEETKIRDERDKNREHNPLIQTPDAILIDTGLLSVGEVVEKIVRIAMLF